MLMQMIENEEPIEVTDITGFPVPNIVKTSHIAKGDWLFTYLDLYDVRQYVDEFGNKFEREVLIHQELIDKTNICSHKYYDKMRI